MPLHLASAVDHFVSQFGSSGFCGASAPSIAVLLFLTGLAGGLAHCGPMCGPFVLALSANGPSVGRLSGMLLLPYHLGRLTSYASLGAVTAGLGGTIAASGPPRWAVAILLFVAAVLFGCQAAGRLAPALRLSWESWGLRWASALAGLARPLLARQSPMGRFGFGLILGLLPCGFLYAALAAAATTGAPAAGALAMGAFGLGTMPSLILVAAGGSLMATRWRTVARRLMAPLLLFNAAALTVMALGAAFAPL